MHHLVLEDYVQAVEAAEARRDRLTAQIAAMLPDWSLAPVVAALQAMRGMALVNAASLIAELGDLSRFANPRQLMAYLGLGAVRAFERRQHQARRHHQSRQQRSSPAADRGGAVLPLPGPGQPRPAAATGGTTQADPRDRLEGHRFGCVPAIASSPGPASPPMSSPPRSPANWWDLSGPSPAGANNGGLIGETRDHIQRRCQQTIRHAAAGQGRGHGRGQENPRIHYLPGRSVRRRSLDRGSSATHHRSCGFDPRIRG